MTDTSDPNTRLISLFAIATTVASLLVFAVSLLSSTAPERNMMFLSAGIVGSVAVLLWVRWERLAFGCDNDDK